MLRPRLFWPMSADPRDPGLRVLSDVYVNHEGLIFRGGRICGESIVPGDSQFAHWERPHRFGRFLVKNYALRRRSETLDSALWVIDNFSPGNYYHWLIDCLARVANATTMETSANVLLLPRYYQQWAFIEFILRAFAKPVRDEAAIYHADLKVDLDALRERLNSRRGKSLGERQRCPMSNSREPSSRQLWRDLH
jgi:hypothetical protein